MKRINFVIAAVFILISSLSNAQSHNEEVTVEGKFVPKIQRSERITQTPDMPERDFEIPNYEINTEDFIYNYTVELEPVSPINYTSNKPISLTNNFLKAGFGTRISPDFIFKHYSNITKRTNLGIGINHNSTWLDMKNYSNTKYMNNAFNISMTNRFSQLQLHSYIDYHYDMYYINEGIDSITNVNSDIDAARKIHSLNVGLSANNNKSSYKSLYDEFLLNYHYTGIQGGMQENLLKLKAHLEHSNSWFKGDDNTQTLTLDINAEADNLEQTLFLAAINPYLDLDNDFYNLHIGFRLDATTNSTSLGGIYPDIKGSLYLFKRNIEFYAAIGGKTKINTLKEVLEENPFLVSDINNIGEFDYEKTKFDFQGGLKFKALNKINARIGIRYRNIQNYIFYVPSFENQGTFDIELSNCTVFNILADVNFRLNDKISATANFAYNNYSRELYYFTHNWYKPNVEFMLKGFYKYNDKWDFNIATYFEGERYAQSFDGNVEKLKPICDIQLGCNYNFKDDLSFYAEVKNLIHNKYQIYYGYPSYGFQMFLGFKYRF